MDTKGVSKRVPGVSHGRIADYESGRRPIAGMSLDVALRLCDALRVSNPRKLLDDKPSEDSTESEKDNTSD